MKYLSYRNLADMGYDESQIKAIAAEYEVQDGPNEEGDMFMRPARPSDNFKEPYENDNEFMMWAAEPKMEIRKRTGIKVVLFLLVFAGIMYAVKKKIWADLKKS